MDKKPHNIPLARKIGKRLGVDYDTATKPQQDTLYMLALKETLGFPQTIEDYKRELRLREDVYARLSILESERKADEAEASSILEWLGEKHIETRYNPALLGGVRYQKPTTSTERARSISLDGGKLRPYSSFPRRRGVVVNLEDEKIHDWQWESWII